jgi:DNA polymerase-3 subunit alpha
MKSDVSFVHLHVHSEFTLSRSLVRLSELVPKVSKMGMPAVAVTDWGNLYGALYFLKYAKEYALPENPVKPIYGAEIGIVVPDGGSQLRHMVLLAKDNEGFKNLQRLVSRAHIEFGFESELLVPKLPLNVLLENSKGLIALTGGMKGILNSFLLQDQEKHALSVLEKLKSSFGEDLFLELQSSSFTPLVRSNEKLLDLGRRQSIPVVATGDVHYLDASDAAAQETWMMVAQKLTLDENPRTVLNSADFYLKSPEEMKEIFSFCPEAISNTLEVASRCNVKLSFKDSSGKRVYYLPDYVSGGGSSQDEFFRSECHKGLFKRLESLKTPPTDEIKKIYVDRIEYELGVITQMGFAGYYLIVSDFIRWAKSQDITVGPGRGSGAGSLAAYCLDITDLDPIEHGLLFERFLNPERVSLPDFDIDFCQERRHEVIRYVSKKYGENQVCQIVTFMKEQSKNALKDVGRVFGMSFAEMNRLTKLIPSEMAKPLSISESLEKVDELRNLVDQDTRVRQVVDLALKIEGALRQPGVHAAGVIIAGRPLVELAPLSRDVNGNLITQWDMKTSEEAGLVKFDFLGLVTLDQLYLTCQHIRRQHPEQNYTPYTIPVHDPRSYELIAKGDTAGVFQLESSGMQNLCTRLKPDRFGDIAAINALFRPGPLESGMVDDFIARKHGKQKVEVIFPEMEEILRETYGVIVYQEQVLEIAKRIGGYSLGSADLLRRAMGKKNPAEMEAQREAFVKGSVAQGKPAAKAGELFDLIEKFAGYGFNKSHAAAYGVLSVQTAFLKAVYPTEFFTALLSIEKENTDKLSRYIQDARARGLKILPPDVNESELDFAIVGPESIRFGLTAIKNVGEAAVEAIMEARRAKGHFKDFFDFVRKVEIKKLNKRVVEALIQAGAFDSLETHETPMSKAHFRGKYLATLEKAMEWAQKEVESEERGQFSLFDGPSSGPKKESSFIPQYSEPLSGELAVTERKMLDWEKELLGIYVSGSPLDKYRDRAQSIGCTSLYELSEKSAGTKVTLYAMVSELREVRIKRGKSAGQLMGIMKLDDGTAQVEMLSFAEHYREYSPLFKSKQPLIFRSELDFEDDSKPKLKCADIMMGSVPTVEDVSKVQKKWPVKLKVHLSLTKLLPVMPLELLYQEIAKVLRRHQGPVPVELVLQKSGSFETSLELGKEYGVLPENALIHELSSMLRVPGAMKVETLH